MLEFAKTAGSVAELVALHFPVIDAQRAEEVSPDPPPQLANTQPQPYTCKASSPNENPQIIGMV
jgi:hypothetical protein